MVAELDKVLMLLIVYTKPWEGLLLVPQSITEQYRTSEVYHIFAIESRSINLILSFLLGRDLSPVFLRSTLSCTNMECHELVTGH